MSVYCRRLWIWRFCFVFVNLFCNCIQKISNSCMSLGILSLGPCAVDHHYQPPGRVDMNHLPKDAQCLKSIAIKDPPLVSIAPTGPKRDLRMSSCLEPTVGNNRFAIDASAVEHKLSEPGEIAELRLEAATCQFLIGAAQYPNWRRLKVTGADMQGG